MESKHKNKSFHVADADLPRATAPRLKEERLVSNSTALVVKEVKGIDGYGRFVPGNNVAEKWTKKTVLPILSKMYETLARDDITGMIGDNPVRSNNIKLQKEVALMCGITGKIYTECK